MSRKILQLLTTRLKVAPRARSGWPTPSQDPTKLKSTLRPLLGRSFGARSRPTCRRVSTAFTRSRWSHCPPTTSSVLPLPSLLELALGRTTSPRAPSCAYPGTCSRSSRTSSPPRRTLAPGMKRCHSCRSCYCRKREAVTDLSVCFRRSSASGCAQDPAWPETGKKRPLGLSSLGAAAWERSVLRGRPPSRLRLPRLTARTTPLPCSTWSKPSSSSRMPPWSPPPATLALASRCCACRSPHTASLERSALTGSTPKSWWPPVASRLARAWQRLSCGCS